MTGLYGVIAVQAALAQRMMTGEGQHIDLSLLDTMVGTLGNQALNYLVSGISPKRMGNAHPNIAPYEVFPTADGEMILAIGNDGQFERFCTLAGLAALPLDARFTTNADRVANRASLHALIAARTVQHRRAEWLAALQDASVPSGPINNVGEVFSDEQVIARAMEIALPAAWAKGGIVPGVRMPVRYTGSGTVAGSASPLLDQHRAEILNELGD